MKNRNNGNGFIVRGKLTNCKNCGKDHVFWHQMQSGKWVLMEANPEFSDEKWGSSHGGAFHDCDKHMELLEQIKENMDRFTVKTLALKNGIINYNTVVVTRLDIEHLLDSNRGESVEFNGNQYRFVCFKNEGEEKVCELVDDILYQTV